MRRIRKTLCITTVVVHCCLQFAIHHAAAEELKVAPRERVKFDFGWRFAFGHAADRNKDFDPGSNGFSYLAKTGFASGAAAPDFDDRAWRELDLPHDWAVEAPFDKRASNSHGSKAIGRNFPDRSVGWYRKTFYFDDDRVAPLDVESFRDETNVIAVVSEEALLQRDHIEREIPAVVKVRTPAEHWKRELFNGLAQVIVRSIAESDELTLVATAPGLEKATLTVRTNQ